MINRVLALQVVRRRLALDLGDTVVRAALAVAALVPLVALGFLVWEMVAQAWPSIVFNGARFFTTKTFSVGNLYSTAVQVRHGYRAAHGASYGILPLIVGTLVCSVLALAVAVPVSVGGAIALVERLPGRLQGALGLCLDVLAGIPSVVFGLWGVYTFGPFVAHHVSPVIAALHVPWLRGPVGSGQGLLTAALVLAAMVIPIIASTTRELVRSVPANSREAAVALGLTSSEVVRVVTVPFVRTGVLAAALLGWARALGETIAVLLVSGNALAYPRSIFSPFATMASTIAAMLDGALTDATGMAVHALAEVGLTLLAVTLLTNVGGRLIMARFATAGLPVGRGV